MNQEEQTKFFVTLLAHITAQTNPLTTLTLGGLDWIQTVARQRAAEKSQNAVRALTNELIAIDNFVHDPATNQQRIAEALLNAPPEAQDTFLDGFRLLMNAIDPAAEPYIARLTAKYINGKIKRNYWFRRTGALLAELHGEVLVEITNLAKNMRKIAIVEFGKFPLDFTHMVHMEVVLSKFLPGYSKPETRIEINVLIEQSWGKTFDSEPLSLEAVELLEQALLINEVKRTPEDIRLIWYLASPFTFNWFVEIFGALGTISAFAHIAPNQSTESLVRQAPHLFPPDCFARSSKNTGKKNWLIKLGNGPGRPQDGWKCPRCLCRGRPPRGMRRHTGLGQPDPTQNSQDSGDNRILPGDHDPLENSETPEKLRVRRGRLNVLPQRSTIHVSRAGGSSPVEYASSSHVTIPRRWDHSLPRCTLMAKLTLPRR